MTPAEHLASMEEVSASGMVGEWAAATDGRRLVLYRGAAVVDLRWEEGKGPRRLAERMVAEESGDYVTTRDALMAWADPPGDPACTECRGRKLVRCRSCGGSGVSLCTCSCGDEHKTECDCDGRPVACFGAGCDRPTYSDVRMGRMYGHLFNRTLLADTLRCAPEALTVAVKAGNEKFPNDMAAWFYGDGFRAVVMGMRDMAEWKGDAPFPSFGASPATPVEAAS
jgi:hypothetical protein